MNSKSSKVSFREKVGYSMGDGAANLVFQMMMMFQLFFYTDVLGITAASAGIILLFARIFDAFVDPMAGIISDRTHTRWGKYRPWILWTALPFSVFFFLSFLAPDFSEKGKILYAGFTYTILMAIYSFNNTPYASLGGVMSSNIKERTSISSIRFVTATIATFVVQGLTLPLVSKFGSGNSASGWAWTIGLYAVVAFILLLIAFFSSQERIKPVLNQKNSIKQDFKDITSCKPWRAMFVLTLFLFVTLAMWGSSMSYYFNYYVDKSALFTFLQSFGLTGEQSENLGFWRQILDAFGLIVYKSDQGFAVGFSFFNIVGQLVTLLGVVLLSRSLSEKFGKRNVFIVCLSLTAVFTALFFIIPKDAIGWLFLINCLKSLAYAPTIPLLWAMMGDVADFSEWKNRRRATGFVFAGIVFALKTGLGLGGALCGSFIGSFGFIANTQQSEHSLLGIRLASSLIPSITFLIGVVALFFYPISKDLNEQIQEELHHRRVNSLS